jgi:hypothetical protein
LQRIDIFIDLFLQIIQPMATALRGLIYFVLLASLLTACKSKAKKVLSADDENVSSQDFVEFFDEKTPPLLFSDTAFKNKPQDSAGISRGNFARFAPDSIFKPLYGSKKPQLYAVGRVRNGEAEHYLFVRTAGVKNAIYLLVFDEKYTYKSSMMLLSNPRKSAEPDEVSIDKNLLISFTDRYRQTDGSLAQYHQIFVYNTAGTFTKILEDGLQQGEKLEVLNPIDSLPRKNKLSGNYGGNENNYLSLRDGSTPNEYQFFLYMNKGQGSECRGELKGSFKLIGSDSAMYETQAEVCMLGFKFWSGQVRITEVKGCSSRHPAGCTFDAVYKRMKQQAPAKKAKGTGK